MNTQVSLDELDRDRRISALEWRVLILTGQVAARDVAITHLLKECLELSPQEARDLVGQFPEMLAEIDQKVLESITTAQEGAPA